MFDWLPEVAREIRTEMINIYWIMLVPFTVLSIALDFFKLPEQNPNIPGILKRVLTSMILLFTFDMCVGTLGMVADGVTQKIDGIQTLPALLDELWQKHSSSEDILFSIKEALIYSLHFLSYIIALVGVYVANVLIKFVWSILYVVSPLMILMWVSDKTSYITKNLYKGLFNVVSWKILWSILGVMLLKFATISEGASWDNQIMNILVNLCIGISMLFIPIAAKSLLNDGMSSAATMMAAVPTMAAFKTSYGAMGKKTKEFARQVPSRAWSGVQAPFKHFSKPQSKPKPVPITDPARLLPPPRNSQGY